MPAACARQQQNRKYSRLHELNLPHVVKTSLPSKCVAQRVSPNAATAERVVALAQPGAPQLCSDDILLGQNDVSTAHTNPAADCRSTRLHLI